MQFAGKTGIAVFILLLVVAAAVGFGSGLLVGRQFPAHRFERMGESWYMMDATTGKVCNPFKDPNTPTNPIDQALTNNQPNTPNFYSKAINPSYPPPCEK